jgi:calcineurin-like phosphoesterase family protein/purple acid phosphatase-like protein
MKTKNASMVIAGVIIILLGIGLPGTGQESRPSGLSSLTDEANSTTRSPAAVIRKGPYLLYPGINTQMTVLWQLDSTESCSLEWGQDTSYTDGSTVSVEYGPDHQHKYTITGLLPGVKYYYRVWVSGSGYNGSFMAAPPDSAQSIAFIAYGDTRTNPDDHDVVCQGIINAYTADPDLQTLLLHGGDWVNHGDTESDWDGQFFNRAWPNTLTAQANLPIQGCMGNHEQTGNLFVKYWPYPFSSDRYWSFDYGPAHFVIVDQYNDYSTASPQLIWLEADLSSTLKEWKFLVFHEPGWSAGGHSNNTDVQTYIQPLCEAYGVSMVINGHNHYYASCEVNGIQHVTAGGGGAPLYPPDLGYPFVEAALASLHFCKVSITDDLLEFEALTPAGALIDSFTIDKGATAIKNWEMAK